VEKWHLNELDAECGKWQVARVDPWTDRAQQKIVAEEKKRALLINLKNA